MNEYHITLCESQIIHRAFAEIREQHEQTQIIE